MHSCGGIDDGYNCAILKHEVGIAWPPKMAHSAPPTRILCETTFAHFWGGGSNKVVSRKLPRAPNFCFLQWPENNCVLIYLEYFENFLSPSKDEVLKVVFAWIKKKKKLHRIFSGHFKKQIFWALQKFSDMCKIFQKLKLRVSGVPVHYSMGTRN